MPTGICPRLFFKGGNRATHHQEQPHQQADHQQELLETSQIEVFVSLVSERDVKFRGKYVRQREEVVRVRVADYDEEGDIDEVHSCTLELVLFSVVDNRRVEQTCRLNVGCNPVRWRIVCANVQVGV